MADPTTSRAPEEAPGYDPTSVERKWQDRWAQTRANTPDLAKGGKPFYQLMMFPYPSAEGLHIGNLYAFTGNDIHGRFQRQRGHTVFQPFGYDAFGIHSENYALKVGVHPSELIPRNIDNFRRQVHRAGLMIDWSKELSTTDRAYYKWTQWIFLQLYHRGLAYKKRASVNWCPTDKTVLANEQVEGGVCERCGTPVEQRLLEQWFFRITDYAPRLLRNLDTMDWSSSTLTSQRNWIGASEGARLTFRVGDDGDSADDIVVFTTRPDTIFGATYLVLAPEHPLVDKVTRPEQRKAVDAYRARSAKQDVVARKTSKDKTGAFTGATAINPATGRGVPIWIADYVLMEYGTGAIMAVPGHDERDFEFATAFGLPIIRVVAGADENADTPLDAAESHVEGARVVNSGEFDGLTVADANARIVSWLGERGAAKAVTTYRLHDWCISRQRYWGPPIPIIYCESCGTVPVPEKDLPVELPFVEDFRPDDSGISPLARHAEWYHVPCPQCGKQARRETDVSDTFLDSAWYFLRYPSADRDDVPFDKALTKRWLPVTSYIGGNEHAVLHLLYSRFVTMVLHDAGLIDFEEPFAKFRAHGHIIREGAKMSKTKGNVVTPDALVDEWGADTLRTYLMFLGPYEEGGDFRERSISGVKRLLDRVWASVSDARTAGQGDEVVMRKLHQTIAKVTDDIGRLSYNTAIAAMMEYVNVLRGHERVPHRAEVEPLVQLLAPFAPHIAEELWETLGHTKSVFDSGWPEVDAARVVEGTVKIAVQVNGKLRATVDATRDAPQDVVLQLALAEAGVARFVTGTPKKIIYVAGRLLSIVV